MVALSHPLAEDVVIRHQTADTFTVAISSGAPQIVCGSLEEALERAGSLATKQQVRRPTH